MSKPPIQQLNFTGHSISEEWIDLRLVSIMRLMLASSALMVTIISAPGTSLRFEAGHVALVLYTFYSAFFYLLSVRRSNLVPAAFMHWLDVGWFVVLVATNGTTSIYFSFFLFAILVASFGWGYSTGLYLTLTSAALFTVVALWIPLEQGVELNRILLRPMQLLILGYLISRWGGFRINLRNQLQLLKDVTVLSHTRFGIDRTITTILESLRRFYDSDGCLLLLPAHEVNGKFTYHMYRVRKGDHPTGTAPPEITAEAAELFLLPWPNHAVIYRKGRAEPTIFNVDSGEVTTADKSIIENVANALETTSYLSIPVHNSNRPTGRIFVIGGPRPYTTAAIDFVLQLMGHVTPSIENIRLVDSLASYAADEERRRIARDIHDSVIQPYVGLQLGIAALAQKLQSGNNNKVLDNVQELLDLTSQELLELRRYVWGLRAGEERRDVLLPAVERFASRFSSVTGIRVDVNAHGKIEVNDRLAAELFQMVTEALSNVRRHALCSDAQVDLSCKNGKFLLQIKNPRPPVSQFEADDGHDHHRLFTPRSISERAALLGGKTVVSIDKKNYTVVSVTIPL